MVRFGGLMIKKLAEIMNRMKEFIFSKNHGKINVKEMLLYMYSSWNIFANFFGKINDK